MICFVSFPSKKVKLTSLELPRFSFLPFLKVSVKDFYFRSSELCYMQILYKKVLNRKKILAYFFIMTFIIFITLLNTIMSFT